MDELNWSAKTVCLFIYLLISFSFETCFHKKAALLFLTSYKKSSDLISEGSCDTEDRSTNC